MELVENSILPRFIERSNSFDIITGYFPSTCLAQIELLYSRVSIYGSKRMIGNTRAINRPPHALFTHFFSLIA